MTSHARLARALVTTALLPVVGALGATGAAAHASSPPAPSPPPYADPYAHGYVGLCDAQGHNVTRGSVYDKPFVPRAVSSAPAPAAYRGPGRKATLYAYQPRRGVDPSDWSGDLLTSASTYSNPSAPMAQATRRDFALSDYLNEFPPQWDGLVELRIYFSAPNMSVDATSYPAADIRVTGTTWTLVRGGHVACTAGTASSPEDALPASNTAGRQPPQRLTPLAAAAVRASPGDGSATTRLTSASAVADRSTGRPAANRPSGAGHVGAVVGLVAAAALAGTGVVFWRRALSRTSTQPGGTS